MYVFFIHAFNLSLIGKVLTKKLKKLYVFFIHAFNLDCFVESQAIVITIRSKKSPPK